MTKKILAFYSIAAGTSVLLMWTILLSFQHLPEGNIELTFHLASEFLMAVMCITGGFLLLNQKPAAKTVNMLALGLLMYSVLNAAGYYGERSEFSMVAMFSILTVLTAMAIALTLRLKQ